MNYDKFDYVLNVNDINTEEINEAISDPRNYSREVPSIQVNPQGIYIGRKDPKLMASWAFGKVLQRDLNSMGAGFSCQVLDCGGEVAVTITHNTSDTGKSASKSFIIVFDDKSGKGIVKSSSTRWRTISGVGQAVSYIRSVGSALANYTNSNN